MKSRIFFFVFSLVILFSLDSCVSRKKVAYLQDLEETSQVILESKFEALISPSDELGIYITCNPSKLAEPYNSQSGIGYLVDVNGDINFPSLGKIHVSGMTRLELQDLLTRLLIQGGYLSNPIVTVRFQNFKIFFLGSEGGKAITITNERCTLLEALALAGDLSPYTRRDRIGVLREEDGRMSIHYVDPRSRDVFNNPYFMLRQNDFIITEARGLRYFQDEISFYTSWLSGITAITSLVTFILMLKRN